MASRSKRLLVLPLIVALYYVHPVLGFIGLACGFVGVLFLRRAREGTTSIAR
jgi:ABC-type transporter Mla maintaining outer membrane lipid asymmetry permease subunit MlaE